MHQSNLQTRTTITDLKAGVLLLKDVKRRIRNQSTELMKTGRVPRGQLTVESGDANYEAWMTLAVETVTSFEPCDKSRQQRVKATTTKQTEIHALI